MGIPDRGYSVISGSVRGVDAAESGRRTMMRLPIRINTLLAAGLVVLTGGAAAAAQPERAAAPTVNPTNVYRLLAQLTTDQAVPRPHARAGAWGVFSGVLRPYANPPLLTWRLNYRGLTGPVRVAQLRIGAAGKSGPVAATLCPPPTCRSDLTGKTNRSFGVGTVLLRDVLRERAYVNIQTRRNPAGELRGQIRVIVAAAG
jgi:hypothetical protein